MYNDNARFDYWGECESESRQIVHVSNRSQIIESVTLRDFYYDGRIKPFGMTGKTRDSQVVARHFCPGDSCPPGVTYDEYFTPLLYGHNYRGVYYGEEKMSGLVYTCSGGTIGTYDKVCYGETEGANCPGPAIGQVLEYYEPIAIFNDSQYAYRHCRSVYGISGTSCQTVSPAEIIENRIQTMLRNDSGQSFYYRAPAGFKSYSTELGAYPGKYLVRNVEGRNIGWDDVGNMVECKKEQGGAVLCTTLKTIGDPYNDGVFDVSVTIAE